MSKQSAAVLAARAAGSGARAHLQTRRVVQRGAAHVQPARNRSVARANLLLLLSVRRARGIHHQPGPGFERRRPQVVQCLQAFNRGPVALGDGKQRVAGAHPVRDACRFVILIRVGSPSRRRWPRHSRQPLPTRHEPVTPRKACAESAAFVRPALATPHASNSLPPGRSG